MLKVFSLEFFMADVPCKLVTVNPGSPGEPDQRRHFQHSHSGCEIHCVCSGALTMDCIGASFQLTSGQMLLIPPGMYHYVRGISANIDRMDLLIEIGKGQKSKDVKLNSFLQALHAQKPLLLEEASYGEIFQLLQRIRVAARKAEPDDVVACQWLKALCLELVLLMGKAAEETMGEQENTVFDAAGMSSDRYIMDQFFNHNYHGNSDMAALAKELNLSVRQTGRVLQKTYGKGFREKMNECRLAVALDLLQNTKKSMAEISEILGYGEPANFSCFVKRQTGKTPAQIRKDKNHP